MRFAVACRLRGTRSAGELIGCCRCNISSGCVVRSKIVLIAPKKGKSSTGNACVPSAPSGMRMRILRMIVTILGVAMPWHLRAGQSMRSRTPSLLNTVEARIIFIHTNQGSPITEPLPSPKPKQSRRAGTGGRNINRTDWINSAKGTNITLTNPRLDRMHPGNFNTNRR